MARHHHGNPLCSFKCASYALKWMDESNDNYLGQPSHIKNHMRVNMKLKLKSSNETKLHGENFPVTRQTKFTNSGSKLLSFPRYRHICLRAPSKCACIALSSIRTHPRYRHTFPVNQMCAYNEYLLHTVFPFTPHSTITCGT